MDTNEFYLYADDANILVVGDSITECYFKASSQIEEIFKWALVNLLTININKCEYVVFGNKKSGHSISSTIDSKHILAKNKVTFLDLTR